MESGSSTTTVSAGDSVVCEKKNGEVFRTCKDGYILSKKEKLLDVSEIEPAWITCRFFSIPPYNTIRFCPFTSGKRAMLLYVLGEQLKHEYVG